MCSFPRKRDVPLNERKEPKETALIKQLLKFNTFRYDKINSPGEKPGSNIFCRLTLNVIKFLTQLFYRRGN